MSPDKYEKSDSDQDLENTFKIFDENGDHFITAEELKNVMQKLGQSLTDEEINLMITEADTDGDRKVNYKGTICSSFIVWKINKSIDELKPIINLFEELRGVFTSAQQTFVNKLTNKISALKQTIEENKTGIDYELISNGILFFACIETYSFDSLLSEFSTTKSLIKSRLNDHLKINEKDLDSALEDLQNLNDSVKQNFKTISRIMDDFK